MKMGYAALTIIILISFMLFSFNLYLNKSVTEITHKIELIDSMIYEEEYKKALPEFKKITEKWKKCEKIFEIQIGNEEIDNINGLLAEIDAYFERGFFEDYFEASYRLKFFLNHLTEKNTVSIETVL